MPYLMLLVKRRVIARHRNTCFFFSFFGSVPLSSSSSGPSCNYALTAFFIALLHTSCSFCNSPEPPYPPHHHHHSVSWPRCSAACDLIGAYLLVNRLLRANSQTPLRVGAQQKTERGREIGKEVETNSSEDFLSHLIQLK